MKIAASIIAYNEPEMIQACLKQFPEWVEKILVCVSEFPWFGNRTDEDYQTVELVKKAMEKDPRIEMVRLPWRTEQEQRNWALGRLYDYDWMLIVDADEFYTPEDWEKMHQKLTEVHLGVGVCTVKGMVTYWKDMDHVWEPADSHKPQVAIRPKRTVFFDKRTPVMNEYFELGITCHHLSWVKSDKNVYQKIKNWMHANDFDSEVWYTNVWKKWTEDMVGLRPYGSEGSTRAIYRPAPESIKSLFVP